MIYSQHTFKDATHAYARLFPILALQGTGYGAVNVPSRYGMTREISAVTNLQSPLHMVPFVYGRRPNYFGMLMESLWPMSTIKNLDMLTPWNSSLDEFSDDGETLYGAYGPRIWENDQLGKVFRMLAVNHGDRQGVISILTPDDAGVKTKDFPCNDMVMFKIRDEKLHMTVMNRSNDVHLGLFGVNTPQFAMLQNWMAHSLGVEVGAQSHVSDSLHLYMETEQHQRISKRMLTSIDGTLGNEIKYLDFYEFFPVKKTYPILENWLPDSTAANRNINFFLEQIIKHVSDMDRFNFNLIFGPTGAILAGLLYTYARKKILDIDHWNALLDFERTFFDIVDVNQTREIHIPFDWIFAGIYTLVHQCGEAMRADAAYEGLGIFMKIHLKITGISLSPLVTSKLYEFLIQA